MIVIRHTGLVTKNIKKSLNFWCDLIGFKVYKDIIEYGDAIDNILKLKNTKVRTIKLKDKKKNLLELLHFLKPKKNKIKKTFSNSIGYTHISITVKDIDKLCKKLKMHKVKFNSPPQISKDGRVKMTYCQTPEGSFLEIVEEL
tara:strand:+ start:10717 stop:11145 length:429 start_codon:yes stop_codon:yes gene_type:complete